MKARFPWWPCAETTDKVYNEAKWQWYLIWPEKQAGWIERCNVWGMTEEKTAVEINVQNGRHELIRSWHFTGITPPVDTNNAADAWDNDQECESGDEEGDHSGDEEGDEVPAQSGDEEGDEVPAQSGDEVGDEVPAHSGDQDSAEGDKHPADTGDQDPAKGNKDLADLSHSSVEGDDLSHSSVEGDDEESHVPWPESFEYFDPEHTVSYPEDWEVIEKALPWWTPGRSLEDNQFYWDMLMLFDDELEPNTATRPFIEHLVSCQWHKEDIIQECQTLIKRRKELFEFLLITRERETASREHTSDGIDCLV